MARPIRSCPKCREVKKLTAHHIFPVKHWGRGPANNHRFLICWTCHKAFHDSLPKQNLAREQYPLLLLKFLEDT